MHNGELGVSVGSSADDKAKRAAAIFGNIPPALYDELALVGLTGSDVTDGGR
jgi:hypothetical protein